MLLFERLWLVHENTLSRTRVCLYVCACVLVCACVCVCERERERVCVCARARVCVYTQNLGLRAKTSFKATDNV